MKRVRKSILLWYSPREMYELVVAVEHYPAFLPWCERAEVLGVAHDEVTARLTLAKGGVRHAFTTRNRHRDGEQVDVSLVDGPFSMLEGHWRFLPIGRAGGAADDDAKACRIEFDMRYAFANAALEAVVSPVFDRIANTLVDSFVQRAEQVHGAR
ncbi:MAG: type II toxin-antitoxin system RatA family toxin [Aquincola sp.]|nr:type II toxin-antitoxin system RatA family toxin [Aquincola sp.]MDH4290854.1 type II toxin-antitoxin system RatA family toxin [Aquincola sp.]MDH5329955.1 type II toxin-antitoxin system RatA family toxin [Aquincola sp.]